MVECTPTDFGRVAAQTARQVIQQRIREAERQAQLEFYGQQVGEIISGIVQAASYQGLTIGLELRAEGILSRKHMIPREKFRVHDRVRALVAEVKDTPRGPQIILSRTHRDFLRRLLENEVPEIYHGVVEIRSISREPGERAKVAVYAIQAGIDPVGACVGIRGVRIQAIVRELHDEKIDVIEWNDDPTQFIAKALSPARVSGVYLDEKNGSRTATVVVSEDQLSLAIGRDGQNARLAAKLTGWRIDIKSLVESTIDTMNKIKSDVELASIREAELEMIPQIDAMLVKKVEGRPLNPEEYDVMAKFVDRVETKIFKKRQPKVVSEEELRRQEIRSQIPGELFEQNILDSGLPEHVNYFLQEAGYNKTGDLIAEMLFQPDNILRLQGIGPKEESEIKALMEELQLVDLPVEEADEPAAVVEEMVDGTDSTEEAEISIEDQVEEVSEELEEEVQEEAIADTAPADETLDETIPDQEAETVIAEEIPEPSIDDKTEEKPSFDEMLAEFAASLSVDTSIVEDDEDVTPDKVQKKKTKRKYIEVEYDPDEDVTIYRRKRKRDDIDWDTWKEK